VYSRQIEGRTYSFGVSGLLYKSNLLMYDHQTESLWSQIKRRAVTGRLSGTMLKMLPSSLTTWKQWKARYPQTEVLTTETGYARDYNLDPYENYYQSKHGLFGLFEGGPGEEEKELVIGVDTRGGSIAFSLTALRQKGALSARVGDERLQVSYDPKKDQVMVENEAGKVFDHVLVYWFVWKAIQPQTRLER